MYSRLAALPDSAEPLQRAQLHAALSVGSDVIQLRGMSSAITREPELDAALAALARGNSTMARMRLARLDHWLASPEGAEHDLTLRARARIFSLSEALAQYGNYFDSEVRR